MSSVRVVVKDSGEPANQQGRRRNEQGEAGNEHCKPENEQGGGSPELYERSPERGEPHTRLGDLRHE
jgi:hypothetical protein